MDNRLKIAILVAVLLAAGVASYLVFLDRDEPAAPLPASSAAAPPARVAAEADEAPSAPPPPMPTLLADDDPVGALVLEGQVIDEDEQPVAGATVTLSSIPERTTTTAEDGGFSFDRLVGKAYALSARDAERVGGPIRHTLSGESAPVVIRLRQGAIVTVDVVSGKDGRPVAEAAVAIGHATGMTGPDGRVVLKGVAAGWDRVEVRAKGFALAQQPLQTPDSPGVEIAVRVTLRPGAVVRGLVVDAAGAPVAGARVVARDPAELVGTSFDGGAESDAKGRFVLDGVAAGTMTFAAFHKDHPLAITAPMATDGVTPLDGVRIQFEAAAVLAGVVVEPGGKPVPWAQVSAGATGGEGGRSALAGEDGRFALKGLPRAAMRVVAEAETASSQVVEVDLSKPTAELTLVLDVTGQIGGVVVDERGEPVADVHVAALPDLLGGGGKDLGLRGVTSATTDGGGRFALRGLADGEYRLAVSRVGGGADEVWRKKGTPARTGQLDVKLVLATDGSLTGRVLYADGSAPTMFTITTGYPPGVPVASKDGRFTIPAVAPGRYDVGVRGADFAETTVRDVVVASGTAKDLGTITVKQGRSVRGTVTGPDGRPVAGATVATATQLLGDGKSLIAELGGGGDEMAALRRTTSGEDGGYVLRGIDEKRPLVLVADHPEVGRARATTIAPGTDGPTIDLALGAVGGVRGRVTLGDKPAGGIAVLASQVDQPMYNVLVTTGLDGRYQIDRLAAGPYQVTAMKGEGVNAKSAGKEVEIRGKAVATADIAIVTGQVKLAVTITGDGGKVDAAQVFLFAGAVDVKTGAELIASYGKAAASGAQVNFAKGASPAVFGEVVAGPHSLCVIPITGDLDDPQVAMRIQKNVDTLAVHCRPHEVAASPLEQAVSLAVPPMAPLPE